MADEQYDIKKQLVVEMIENLLAVSKNIPSERFSDQATQQLLADINNLHQLIMNMAVWRRPLKNSSQVPFICLICHHQFTNTWLGYSGYVEDLPRVWELYECPNCRSKAIMALD